MIVTETLRKTFTGRRWVSRTAATGKFVRKLGNISDRDFKALVDASENAPAPGEALLKAAKAYCAR